MRKLFFLDKVPPSWARFCAQCIDYSIVYLSFCLASLFLPFYIEDLYYLGFAFFIPILWAPLEGLLVSLYKTTPGKALFGIRVENHLGGRLPFLIALKRSCFFGTRPGVIRQKALGLFRSVLAVSVLFFLTGVSFFEKDIAVLSAGFEKYKSIDGWIDYTSCEGGFRVLLPEVPEEASKVLPVPSHNKTLNYQEITSHQTQKVYYSISYMNFPKKWKLAGAQRLLQGALDLIVEHIPGTQILFKSMTKHKNFRALDFHLTQGSEEVQGRLILVGTTLYRLTVVYPPELANQLQQNEFLDSFEVQG
jgi:uncharacterized RDD family membrane protein YckC